MNAYLKHTIATRTPTAPIPKDHFTAHVIQDTLGMVSLALVSFSEELTQ